MGVQFHFLNVGQGDCTIVHFPHRTRKNDGSSVQERIMMVDIYQSQDHPDYEDVIAYYKRHFRNPNGTIKPIFRFVCTHPHQDHLCGLAQLCEQSGIEIINFWDLDHEWEPDSFDGHPTHEDDWRAYQKIRKSSGSPTIIRTHREDLPRQFWNDDEDRVVVLSPSEALRKHAHSTEDGKKRPKHEVEIDEMSYALLIRVNDRKVILAGDGRATPCWDDIYENCKSHISNAAVLKAGHHGHEAGMHEEALKLMNPDWIVFSNSTDLDDENGAEDLYSEACPSALILKTCDVGSIVMDVPFESSENITYSTGR